MRLCLLAAASLLALPAAAQDKPPPPTPPEESEGEILVLGRGVREDQVRDFVSGLTGTMGNDPLMRFEAAELCPFAFGLTPTFDKAITTRMRRVATAANIRVAPEGCRANALVIFAADKDAAIQTLRKGYPRLFYQPTGEPVRLLDRKEPVTSWQISDFVDADGVPLTLDGESGQYVLESSGAASRITAASRPVYRMSVVVIETGALEGLTTTQVADYAAMRTFTGADPDRVRASKVPTILTIVDAPMGSEVPLSMTPWDLGFLRAFYATPPNQRASSQRSAIRKKMTVTADQAAARPKPDPAP